MFNYTNIHARMILKGEARGGQGLYYTVTYPIDHLLVIVLLNVRVI